jgi:hypothetical protein
MDEVVFGRPASEVIVEQMDRLGATSAFLMVSGTLNRETDVIETIRRAIGPRCVGTFDAMPAHTPRTAVISAANQARAAHADLIVTIGGGSITDGAKAVQLCLANDVSDVEGIDRIRAVGGASPALNAPTVRQISAPTTIAGGEFTSIAGVTNEKTRVKEALRHPLLIPRVTILDPALAPTRRSGCGCRLASAPSIIASRALLRRRIPCRRPGAQRASLEQALPREGGWQRSRRTDGLPDRDLAFDGTFGLGRADGRQPWHRLCARGRVRRAARPYLVRDAAVRDALEQAG